MINTFFNEYVDIYRRVDTDDASRDALGNPVYGKPTEDWNLVAEDVYCRLAFSSKTMVVIDTGERIQPSGKMYYGKQWNLFWNDRILTKDGREYYIDDVVPGYEFGQNLSHYEAVLKLP